MRGIATYVSLGGALASCSEPIFMGSEVIWQARHETQDLSEWGAGGNATGPEGFAEISEEQSRHGRFALRLSNPADHVEAGGCVTRNFAGLPEAYYSAWYFLPEAPLTPTGWTLLRLRSSSASTPEEDGSIEQEGAAGAGHSDEALAWRSVVDLAMRSLPDGSLALYVFFHDRDYLQLPVAVPAPLLPVGRWFHLEVFYRTTPEPAGRFVVWLDDAPVYSVADRRLGDGSNVAFALCNSGRSQGEEPVTLYVDEVVVSRIRATPAGVLER